MIEPKGSTMRPSRRNSPSVIDDLAFRVPLEFLSLTCVLLKIGEAIERGIQYDGKRDASRYKRP
jgi:hypothetical protein